MTSYAEPWYNLIISEGVTPDLPGIYEWRIEGAGSYIERYTHSSRPLKEYANHVKRQFNGGHYRLSNPDGWRRIHIELYIACLNKRQVDLIFVKNCSPLLLNEREKFHIKERGILNGARLPKAQDSTPPESKLINTNPIEIDTSRNVARRLAIYHSLIGQFELSASTILGEAYQRNLQSKFFSDICHLMSIVQNSDEHIAMMEYFGDEMGRQAEKMDNLAQELSPD